MEPDSAAALLPQAFVEACFHDPHGLIGAPPAASVTRALARLARNSTANRVATELKALLGLMPRDFLAVFPTRAELLEELIPRAIDRTARLEAVTLSASSPVAFPDRISLNLVIRLFSPERKLTTKIKVAVFVSPGEKIWYEVGFVRMEKSLQSFSRNYLNGPTEPGDYFLLRDLVSITKGFILRRPIVAGLDLTPAAYHVLALCRRLGGRPEAGIDIADFVTSVRAAYLHSRPRLLAAFGNTAIEKVNERYLISWMFQQGLIEDPKTARTMSWQPPRLVWSRRSPP